MTQNPNTRNDRLTGVSVDVCRGPVDIADHWRALCARATAPEEGNVFLDPTALNTVFQAGFAKLLVLLAWRHDGTNRQLVGVWAIQKRKLTPVGPTVLSAPPYDYSFVSGPVIDPTCRDLVAPAMLKAIADAPDLPNVLLLKYLDSDATAGTALVRALAGDGIRSRILADRPRAFQAASDVRKLSGSTRKKLRQNWNRLSELGPVEITNNLEPAVVAAAFETFLALEAGGWKGAEGSAILSHQRDADFARRLIRNLSQEQKASVALLKSGDQSIAAQVLLYSGAQAYTWKIAFDERYARFSPGTLLVDKLTEQLLDGDIEAIESCSPEGGFMSQIWSGRRPTIDVLAEVSGRFSLGYLIASLNERGRTQLKSIYKRMNRRNQPTQAVLART